MTGTDSKKWLMSSYNRGVTGENTFTDYSPDAAAPAGKLLCGVNYNNAPPAQGGILVDLEAIWCDFTDSSIQETKPVHH